MLAPLFYVSCIIFLANDFYSVNKVFGLFDVMNSVFDQYIQKYGSKSKKSFREWLLIGVGIILGIVTLLIGLCEMIMIPYNLDFGCYLLVCNTQKAWLMAACGGFICAMINIFSVITLKLFDLIEHKLN